MNSGKPGAWMDHGPYISGLDWSDLRKRVPTDRYHSRHYQQRERDRLWMRVWQIAGRVEELPEAGDWKVHRIYDQSFILVRGRDGQIRGFVNACRHRGNRLCAGAGHSARFTCQYHLWTFNLDGRLAGVARPDFDGTLEEFVGGKEELGLVPISVECFGGFIFINPDRDALPLDDFLGPAKHVLEAYRMEQWVAVGVNVRETLECNWKVVMDAFGEGYHVQGIHPELVGLSDLKRERFQAFGLHCASTVPFGPVAGDVEQDVKNILGVPTEQFPLYADILPRFSEVAESFRGTDGKLAFPQGTTPRSLFQRMIRELQAARGYDVSLLTDTQMTDYQYWLFFPNVFMQVCVGDATIIITDPHPDGDLNRCVWHVMFLHWLPPAERALKTTPVQIMPAGEHFPYHYVLDQDFNQLPIAHEGLRNRLLREIVLTRNEPRVAHFHGSLDRWVE